MPHSDASQEDPIPTFSPLCMTFPVLELDVVGLQADPNASDSAAALAQMDKPRARQLLQGLVPASDLNMRRCIDLLKDSGISALPPTHPDPVWPHPAHSAE